MEYKEEILEKDTVAKDTTEDLKEENVEVETEAKEDDSQECEETSNNEEDELEMMKKHKEENKKLKEELEAINDRLLRITAEYDNYRKRTSKEKQGIYGDACVDVLKEVVPILDNLERAIEADGSVEDLKKGVEMTIKGCKDSFDKLGITEIDTSSEFDPNFHQAVMHIEDENLEKNKIVEVFLKGYQKEDKIIRYSVVKVAN